jgi:hypothetical protein
MLTEYKKHLKSSQLLTGKTGDIFYWPDTFWHVGEGAGSFNATMTIGFDFRPTPGYILGPSVVEELCKGPDQINADSTGYHFEKDNIFPNEFLPLFHKMEDAWLLQKTSLGIRFPIPEIKCKRPNDNDLIKLQSKSFPILSKMRENELSIYTNGHQFSLPALKSLENMIKIINLGKPIKNSRLQKLSGMSKKDTELLISFLLNASALSIQK